MKPYNIEAWKFENNADIKLTKLNGGKKANKILKSGERQKAKREIKKELKNG